MTPHDFRSLDLNLLRVFDTVMAEGSLTRAADQLAVAQPAVSNAMRRLRDALGDELLVRRGHGYSPRPGPSPCGRWCARPWATCSKVWPLKSFDPATATLTVVLAMADATASALVPDLVPLVEREAPHLSIRIVPLTTRDPRGLLDAEAADMAVGHFPAVLADLTARAQAGTLRAPRAPPPVRRRVCGRHAQRPPPGLDAADAGALLRRQTFAGEFFRPRLWVY